MTSKRDRTKQEILTVLEEELGGEVRDAGGLAVRRIFERIASTESYTTVSSLMSDLEAEGKIIRDMPSLKRTTRVALAGRGFAPPVKDLKVVLEQFSRTMVDGLEGTVNRMIDAHVEIRLQQERAEIQAEADAELRAENERLQAEVERLKGAVQEARQEPMRLRSQLDQAEADRESLEDRLKVAEHNAEVWRQNAMGRPRFREAMSALRDRLDDDERKQLDRLMRSLPEG